MFGNKSVHLSGLVQWSLLFVSLILVWIALLCPDPFTDSGVAMLHIVPYNVSSSVSSSTTTSTSTGGTTVFSATTTDDTSTSGTSTATPTSTTTSTTPTSTSSTAAATTTSAASNTSTTSATDADDAVAKTATAADDAVVKSATAANDSAATISARSLHLVQPSLQLVAREIRNDTSDSESTELDYSSSQLSHLEYKLGPLGACFRDANNKRTCSPASLAPSLSSINTLLGNVMTVSSLPTQVRVTPILILVVFSVLVIIIALATPMLIARLLPSRFGQFLDSSSWVQRYLVPVQSVALYARLASAILLLGAAASLRVKMATAVYDFNAANAGQTLASDLTLVDSSEIGMEASVGSTFGLVWAAVILIFVESFLERRRIRRQQAVAVARADIERQYGKDIFELLKAQGADTATANTAKLARELSMQLKAQHPEVASVQAPSVVYANCPPGRAPSRAASQRTVMRRAPSYKAYIVDRPGMSSSSRIQLHPSASTGSLSRMSLEKGRYGSKQEEQEEEEAYDHLDMSNSQWAYPRPSYVAQDYHMDTGSQHSPGPFTGSGWDGPSLREREYQTEAKAKRYPPSTTRTRQVVGAQPSSRSTSPAPSYWTATPQDVAATAAAIASRSQPSRNDSVGRPSFEYSQHLAEEEDDDRRRADLIALEREILSRRRAELEWQAARRGMERSAGAATPLSREEIGGSGSGRRDVEEGLASVHGTPRSGLAKLRYVKE